jgi:hypothetical protein
MAGSSPALCMCPGNRDRLKVHVEVGGRVRALTLKLVAAAETTRGPTMVTQGPEDQAFSELKTDFLSKRKIRALSTRS